MIIQMHYTKRPIINTSEFISKWKGWKNENVNPKEQQDSVEFFNYLLDSFPKKAKDLFKGEIINFINDDVSKNEHFYYLSIPVKTFKFWTINLLSTLCLLIPLQNLKNSLKLF